MSAYYATGGPAQGPAGPSTLTPAQVWFSGPLPQSRVTVAFRLLMAIPHFIVLWLMAIAAGVVVFIGWWGALFTGRLPVFAADFLTGYVRWVARVQAYTCLLTDEYPPFALGDADYPVRVAVTPGQQLNRAAVFFRLFLLIPCWFVQTFVTYGALTVFQLVNWLIVLVKGQPPEAIYQALSAVLRFQVRVLAFALMLTSTYPANLFGDADLPGLAPSYGPQDGYGYPQPGYGAPQPGYGAPQGYAGYGAPEGGLPAYGGPRGYVADGPGYGTAVDPAWRLILSRPARKLMIFFIVFGVALSVASNVVNTYRLSNNISSLSAQVELAADAASVNSALSGYSNEFNACGEKLACITRLDRETASTLDLFTAELRTISVPSKAVAARARLISVTSDAAAAFAKLGAATSADQYQSVSESSGAGQAVEQFDPAYNNLVDALTS
jgi:hypothetical protein